MGARWAVENRLFARLRHAGFPAEHHRHLRYEDLASRPEETLEQIQRWLGLDPCPGLSERFRELENHCISGNEMRWRGDQIRLDQRWREALPAGQCRAIWALTWPTRLAFGYV